ncbi:sterol desaturase family protein [Limnohabitans radicicola]|uniref:Sterol desaturase family protein n=1 Tax=Limnohabitans radicicola TaxID=2771427 RepID=A0A927FID5_9BURK|nr:sterol desaturase family protein [Limnohabitans radicicola]MBD8051281.1 sterol desaturase family protein [Limnohabitans radicicola]
MNASQIQNLLVVCLILGFAIMEFISRRYRDTVHATGNDTKLELFMFLSLLAITQPIAILTTSKLGAWLAPQYKGMLADWPWWAMVGILILADDLTQYWWHRLSHSPLLWPLHRAHHSAEYMSIRVTFRNNFFYYLMMPGLWFAGALLYLGVGGMVYAMYVVVKLFVILGAHCAWRWDEPLYRIPALRPLMWVLERTISTPATHWAHHAITNEDGIGHYKGNFGNLLFIWDQIFGSALITRKFPERVGLIDDKLFGQERWYHQMFFPLLQSSREHTALKFGGSIYEGPATAAVSPTSQTGTTA